MKKELSIETRTVAIKVIKVGGSKMTISVFNQIIEERVFDIDGNLKGEVLGYIYRNNEYWILWVNEQDELRKIQFPRSPLNIDDLIVKKEDFENMYVFEEGEGENKLVKDSIKIPDEFILESKYWSIIKRFSSFAEIGSFKTLEEISIRKQQQYYYDDDSYDIILDYQKCLEYFTIFHKSFMNLHEKLFTKSNQIYIAT